MEGLRRHKLYLEVREREIQWDRITGVCRAGIIWEINRSSGEMEVETAHKTLLGQSGQRYWRAGMGRYILELYHGMDWDPGTLGVQEGLFPVPTTIKRSLPFFTWIAEPWPWRWTTAGCKGEQRDGGLMGSTVPVHKNVS